MRALWVAVLSFSLFVATSAAAATDFPSVAGEWTLYGAQKISGSVKGVGSGSDHGEFYASASFNEDGTLLIDGEDLGTWKQIKTRVLIDVDTTSLEAELNDYIYAETGVDVYVDFVGATGKASVKKDGVRLTSGKLYVKFTISYGDAVVGKGAYKVNFKGDRNATLIDPLAASLIPADDSFEANTSDIVKAFGDMIIKGYLKK